MKWNLYNGISAFVFGKLSVQLFIFLSWYMYSVALSTLSAARTWEQAMLSVRWLRNIERPLMVNPFQKHYAGACRVWVYRITVIRHFLVQFTPFINHFHPIVSW